MGRVIPTANAFSVDIDNVCTALAQLTRNGIATAEATTYYNAMLNELGKSGTTADKAIRELSGKGFTELIKEGKPLTEILKILDDTAKKNGQSLSDMFGSAEGAKAALTIMKNDGTEYNEILGQMKNSAGSTEEAFKKIDSTASEQLSGSLNELKNAGIELGTSLIPLVKEGAGMIKDLAGWINSLSDSQKQSIVKIGLWVAALGPILSVGGKVVGVVGKISTAFKGVSTIATAATGVSTATSATGIAGLVGKLGALVPTALPIVAGVGAVAGSLYALHERNELLNTSLSTTEEELPFVQKMWNNLNGHVIKSKEEMENLGLKYEEWSDDIAPEVAESVDETAEKWRNLNVEIDRLNTNGIKLDKKTAENLNKQTNEICQGIIDEIKAHQSEGTKELTEYFNTDGTLDTYESTILSFLDKDLANQVALIDENRKKILDINNKASEENRQLYDSEKIAIQEYQDSINQIKIDALSKNNDEREELTAQFSVKMRKLDLDGASELMQEKANLRDDEISKIQENYDTKIEILKSRMGEMNTQERIAATAKIEKLENDRDSEIQIQKDTYNSYLKVLEEKYPEIYDRIEFWSGKTGDVDFTDAKKKLETQEKYFRGLAEVTETGMQTFYDMQTGTYHDVYVEVDKNTGKILGTWDKTTGDIIAYNDDVKASLVETQNKYIEADEDMRSHLKKLIDANKDWSSGTKNSNKNVVDSLRNITQTSHGTYEAIMDINGEPVKVEVNKDGTITDLEEIINKMGNIPKTIYTTVLTTYKDANGNDFQASRYYSNGRGGYEKPVGSTNYNGLDSVPYDGYTARLHKGERVLTAEENREYSNYNKAPANTELTIKNYVQLDGQIIGKKVDKVNGASLDMERRQLGLL